MEQCVRQQGNYLLSANGSVSIKMGRTFKTSTSTGNFGSFGAFVPRVVATDMTEIATGIESDNQTPFAWSESSPSPNEKELP